MIKFKPKLQLNARILVREAVRSAMNDIMSYVSGVVNWDKLG